MLYIRASGLTWESSVTKNMLSFIMWIVLMADYAQCFPKEREFVWKPILAEHSPLSILGVYLFTRYIGVIGQTVNVAWRLKIILSSEPSLVGRHHCWSWFAFQSLVIQLLFAATQFILMLRVWVLYHRTRVTLGFLGLLWAWERLVMMGTALIISFNIEFGPQCVQDRSLGYDLDQVVLGWNPKNTPD